MHGSLDVEARVVGLGGDLWLAVPGRGSSDSTSSASTHCVPNGDNVLSALELNAVPGASRSFLRATGVPVDTAGVTEAHRQQYYLAECRGIVGAVLSETQLGSEPPPDFSLADGIARLEN